MIPPVLQATSSRSRSWRRALLPVLALALLAAGPGDAQAQARSSLAVLHDGLRHTWWRSDAAPPRWNAPDSTVLSAIRWTDVRPGLRLGELDLAVNRGLLRLRVVVVEAALPRFRLALEHRTAGGRAAWNVDVAPASAVLAVNAGQFTAAGPWGWLVMDGRVRQAPGTGPLSAALAADSAGVRWLAADTLAAAWGERRWEWAFQSYPVLLHGGTVPAALRAGSAALDLRHRDTRLALGLRGDTLLLALTRYAGAGAWLGRLPAGLTTPETAALMGALGARDAVMLDGGLSAQLLVRGRDGVTRAWRGARDVPLGLLLTERAR